MIKAFLFIRKALFLYLTMLPPNIKTVVNVRKIVWEPARERLFQKGVISTNTRDKINSDDKMVENLIKNLKRKKFKTNEVK